MIDIVSATRLSSKDFWSRSALGQSLKRLAADTRLRPQIACRNRKGLPEVYNARLAAPDCAEAVVFVHDDVWIEEADFADRVLAGLAQYDVIGVAGNRRRLPYQPAWAFVDIQFNNDAIEHFSGAVGHGQRPRSEVSVFGDTPADVELLDGVFIAARASSLKAQGVQFDPRFQFHFYDMDFCRSVREKGLRMGTWPVWLTHQSAGAFGSPAWFEQYRAYIEKWGR
jgi:GT2 family glycosyltransferase